ncbi:O-antigen ligase family protein [Robertmurraya korlensis]|uniref:O-antigen ligase family protein n=1 Tax=Robertmurraya korlensis TaxID=519977 RepID=UPI00203F84AE
METISVNTLQLNSVRVPFTLSLFFISILMHQSNIIFGINLSLADIFCIFTLVHLIAIKKLYIPVSPLLCFLFLSVQVIFTASFYIPIVFNLHPYPASIINDYFKLLAIFGYFLLGYNLSKLNLMEKVLNWYSLFGIIIGSVGIIWTFLNVNLFRDLLFFGGSRYRGLMIDPNYYSVLLVTAIVYFTRIKTVQNNLKYLAILVTILSVLISGSKTGLITLGCYFLLRLLEYLLTRRKKLFVLAIQVALLTMVFLLTPLLINFFHDLFNTMASNIPSFGRVYYLFVDFNAALSEGGSGRETTWVTALQVIQASPFVGVGIGTYTLMASKLFNYDNVAHNTFLQLSAEWGLPLACAFFLYIFFALGKTTFLASHSSTLNIILRDIIVILLIGSMAISLNNARMLWLFLGALVFSLRLNHFNSHSESEKFK